LNYIIKQKTKGGILMGLFNKKKLVVKKATSTGKKKPFGGYSICFAGRTETIEEVFGKKDLAPSEMTKKIWAFVKENKLAGKK
jgi:hypothetical protein